MSFNGSKCKHLSISKKKKPTNSSYQLGNNIIAMTRCEKDLGILVNNKLSWHDHIVNKVNTANKVLRLIRRSGGSCVIADVTKKLYVHPSLMSFLLFLQHFVFSLTQCWIVCGTFRKAAWF